MTGFLPKLKMKPVLIFQWFNVRCIKSWHYVLVRSSYFLNCESPFMLHHPISSNGLFKFIILQVPKYLYLTNLSGRVILGANVERENK